MLSIPVGSVKKFSFRLDNKDITVIGVYLDDVIVRDSHYALLTGYTLEGKFFNKIIKETDITFTATKLDSAVRDKFQIIYELYCKKKNSEQLIKKYEDEIKKQKNKIDNYNNKFKSVLDLVLNKQGYLSNEQFANEVLRYLTPRMREELSSAYIYSNILYLIKEVTNVDRMNLREAESRGLGYFEYDMAFMTYSWDEIQDKKFAKELKDKYGLSDSFKCKKDVHYDYDVSDKGHISFSSTIQIELKKSLTKEYAKSIAYKILGKATK